MIRYPKLPEGDDSDIDDVEDGREVTVTEGGAIRERELWSGEIYHINLFHSLITPDQWRMLKAFYQKHRRDSFVITFQGCRYQCKFKSKPAAPKNGPVYRDATVLLIGTLL